ncbi:IS481 family transposase [Phytoactinopolyspora limicola]|uniref:IS481 family transposase n=1 Tax=Phytoactinopolyspora limicola TaxID=2715536 RepID=UPI001A9C5C29|nr:IS481 family transposase [Phytoactinopolyspora limicola]
MDIRMAAALAGAVPNVSVFCAEQGISRQTFYKWRRRFAEQGVDGLAERSRRPLSSPAATPGQVEDEIVKLRKRLTEDGEDNGPEQIRWRLLREQPTGVVPSRTTIWRVLVRRGLVTPAPAKRPKSSLRRFVYARPNECWQSDWTAWSLTDGTPVAIAGTLDDHSRYLAGLGCEPGDGTGPGVWAVMTAAISECGVPAMSLTDNGWVYSGYRRGQQVAFETNLHALGTQTICSSPYHPQTCGKIERLWQTLKKWLRAQDPPTTLDELDALLTAFRHHYNHHRPHRALAGATPAEAFTATTKARPAPTPLPEPVTTTTSTVTPGGAISVGRYTINVGRRWAGHTVTTIRHGHHTTIFSGNRLVRELTINPNHRYQPSAQPRYDLRGHREPQPT